MPVIWERAVTVWWQPFLEYIGVEWVECGGVVKLPHLCGAFDDR
jgi:hypothetical protein